MSIDEVKVERPLVAFEEELGPGYILDNFGLAVACLPIDNERLLSLIYLLQH